MLFWFNPFFYLMKRELRTIHEFLADEFAVAGNEPMDYAELLLVHSIGRKKAGLTSPMFQETIKRRIIMITHFGKARYGFMRRLMILPVVLFLFCAFGLRDVRPSASGVRPAAASITVMVDAGHGGIDPGAVGGGTLREKDLTLQLAQKIKALGSQYNLTVILTRNSDILPGNAVNKRQGLENRVAMAKEAGARAFISLHVNNTGDDEHPLRTTGYEAYVSKRRDSRGSELLAAALLKRLGPIYTTFDQIQKRSEEGIYVLDQNTCPATVLECGYIDNPKDVKFFQDNQESIARSILQGIVDCQAGL
jgi:N-acetylmuramoyl-L-alanine amidase